VLLFSTVSDIELIFTVLIVHLYLLNCFKYLFAFFTGTPLGLGVLLSQCLLYFLLTEIDICELVKMTKEFKFNVQ